MKIANYKVKVRQACPVNHVQYKRRQRPCLARILTTAGDCFVNLIIVGFVSILILTGASFTAILVRANPYYNNQLRLRDFAMWTGLVLLLCCLILVSLVYLMNSPTHLHCAITSKRWTNMNLLGILFYRAYKECAVIVITLSAIYAGILQTAGPSGNLDWKCYIWMPQIMVLYFYFKCAKTVMDLTFFESAEGARMQEIRKRQGRSTSRSKRNFQIRLIAPVIVGIAIAEVSTLTLSLIYKRFTEDDQRDVRENRGYEIVGVLLLANAAKFFTSNVIAKQFFRLNIKNSSIGKRALHFITSMVTIWMDSQVRVLVTMEGIDARKRAIRTSTSVDSTLLKSTLLFAAIETIQRIIAAIFFKIRLAKIPVASRASGIERLDRINQREFARSFFSIQTNANLVSEYAAIHLSMLSVYFFSDTSNMYFGRTPSSLSLYSLIGESAITQYTVELLTDIVCTLGVQLFLNIELSKHWRTFDISFIFLEVIACGIFTMRAIVMASIV